MIDEDVERRLTYRREGQWWYSGTTNGGRGPIGFRVWLHAYRVVDRLVIGRDNGRNHW